MLNNEVKLKLNQFDYFLDFMKIFRNFNEIDIQYYWDVTDEIEKLKKQGYLDDDIENEYGYTCNRDHDEEYSFNGTYEELILYTAEYDCYDNLNCISIDNIKIEINENNYKVFIELLVV